MLRCTVCLVVVAFVAYSRTEQMCLPDKVQYTLLITPQSPMKNKLRYVEQFVDFENKKILSIQRKDSTLLLFNQHTGYIFNDTSCSKGEIGSWVDFRCISQTAVPSKPYRLGWNPGLSVVDYYWQSGSYYIKASVAANIAPLQVLYMSNGTSRDQSFTALYENYVPYINDTHTFDVPGICKNASMMSVGQQEEIHKFVPKYATPVKKSIKERN